MESIRKEAPNSYVLVGDILGTYAFEEVLEKYPEVICVRGEGEKSFRDFIKMVLNPCEKRLEDIPNLAYISNGKLILTKRSAFDLSKAKRPNRILAREVLNQHGIGRVEASRGCSYSLCKFCGTVEKYNGPGWRPFDLDFVEQELITISQMGFQSPYFTDEDFYGDDIPRILELADRIEKAKARGAINPRMDFYINLRAASILGVGMGIGGKEKAVKILKRLKQVGLREIFVGIESGCKEQLCKRYRKGITKQRNIEAIDTIRDLGLEVDLGFIFFDRESTLQELRENLNFIAEAKIAYHDSQLIKKMRIEPRTPLGFEFIEAEPQASIDLNLVEYPYKFRYSDVERIYYAFSDWQEEDLDVIYNLQSFCRGEIPKGYTRAEVKNIISKYRELDVEYLKRLVRIFESAKPSKDSQIKVLTRKFKKIRTSFDQDHIDRVRWLDSSFRRFSV